MSLHGQAIFKSAVGSSESVGRRAIDYKDMVAGCLASKNQQEPTRRV